MAAASGTSSDSGTTESNELEYNAVTLIGQVSSVSNSTIIIEPLVATSISDGDVVIIKRRNIYGQEEIITQATIITNSNNRIEARYLDTGNADALPKVRDLIYQTE